MDTRLAYLLTLLPPLPPLGDAPPLSLAEALTLLRQQGGADLESLAALLEAEAPLREALDEWVLNDPGSRTVPAPLPPPLMSLFDEGAAGGMGEADWVSAVWDAYLALAAATGRSIGSPLLTRWSVWEGALRRGLARRREQPRADGGDPAPQRAPQEAPGLEAVLAAWSETRSQGAAGGRLAAAMEAEIWLDRARLGFLDEAGAGYSFSMDELAAYLLRLRLLERHRRLDGQRGRALLEEVMAQ